MHPPSASPAQPHGKPHHPERQQRPRRYLDWTERPRHPHHLRKQQRQYRDGRYFRQRRAGQHPGRAVSGVLQKQVEE